MRYLILSAVGAVLVGFALCSLAYGVAVLVEGGSCGEDTGRVCQDGTGAMIGLIVLGSFGGIVGAGLFAARGEPEGHRRDGMGLGVGIALGQGVWWLAAIPAAMAGVAVGVIDFHEDDTRPGLEILAAGLGPALVVQLLIMLFRDEVAPSGVTWRRGPAKESPYRFGPQPTPQAVAHSMGFAPPPPPSTPSVHAQLAQLDAAVRSGHISPAEYETERRRVLAGGH